MLDDKEIRFIENRKKIGKLLPPFLGFFIGLWFVIYVFMFFSFPEVSRFGREYDSCPYTKFLPVFYNLFMVVLLVLFVSFFVYLTVEKEYLRIIKKLYRGKPP